MDSELIRPTWKDPQLVAFLEKFSGRTRGGKQCSNCGAERMKRSDFRDEGGRKEAAISWMCQECQDNVGKEANVEL
jgi:hypothetical protein